MPTLLIIYIIGILPSTLLISGWHYAESRRWASISTERESAADALIWGVFFGLLWPLGIPAGYLASCFARDGWLLIGRPRR